ncbi:suppressor of fused domain protein [Anaerosinus massiliensis]|uniref:suppressor of fused domain protein n=1 Tax=Massilibacillus massiliensis TaxID=1806837 RepID=UPI000B0A30E7|nr:suppressor of fused domain protein [Massilibacillus massiliensis]
MMSVSNEKKQLANYVANIFDGKASVFTYGDDNEKSKIAILHAEESPNVGETSYSTIGLSDYNIDLDVESGPLRVEIVAAAPSDLKEYGNVISTCAFNIINSGYSCFPGTIYPDVVQMYYPDYHMKHIMFVSPFLWDEKLETKNMEDKIIAWLQAIPISESEYQYVEKNGVEIFLDLLEKSNIDILDLDRESVV